MKKLAVLLALIALTACQDSPTRIAPLTPTAPSMDGHLHTFEPAPPPPTDTGVAAVSDAGTGQFNVTYFYNTQGTNGFLTFKGPQPAGTEATKGARVQYQDGIYSGRGTLTYQSGVSIVNVDLSSVAQASSFRSCAAGCFNVSFSRATATTAGRTRDLSGVHVAPFLKRGTVDGPILVVDGR